MGIFQKRSPDNPLAALEPPPPERQPQPVSPSAPPPFLRDNEVRTQIGPGRRDQRQARVHDADADRRKAQGGASLHAAADHRRRAVVEGWVKADDLRIEGLLRGEIAETRKVEICPQGRLVGKVSARLLVVRDGAFFEGQCAVGPESTTRSTLGTGTESASG